MTTASLISLSIIIYFLSIWGAREELVMEGEKISGGVALLIYVPLFNTIMTIVYLVALLSVTTQNDINSEIDDNQRKNFRNDLKKYKHNNE
jgi:hypothetical protein